MICFLISSVWYLFTFCLSFKVIICGMSALCFFLSRSDFAKKLEKSTAACVQTVVEAGGNHLSRTAQLLIKAQSSKTAVQKSPLPTNKSPQLANKSPLSTNRSQVSANKSQVSANKSPLSTNKSPLSARQERATPRIEFEGNRQKETACRQPALPHFSFCNNIFACMMRGISGGKPG